MMKRQRNLHVITKATKIEGTACSATTIATPSPQQTPKKMATTAKKKSKRAIEEVEEKEERKSSGGGEFDAVVLGSSLVDWEAGLWLSDAVALDEQMSWGSNWLPFWDVEYVGKAYSEIFGDVAWDDDIWNLKSINKIPSP